MRILARPARRSLLLAGLLVLSLLTWTGCEDPPSDDDTSADASAEEETAPAYTVGKDISDSTIAVVLASKYRTDTISASQFEMSSRMVRQSIPPRQQRSMGDSLLHSRVIENLIVQHVVTGYALQNGVEVDSLVVDSLMEQQRQPFTDEDGNVDEKGFEQALEQQGLTQAALREIVKDQILFQRQQRSFAEEAEAPTTDTITYVSEQNRPIDTQHILLQVSDTADQSTVDSVRQVASAIIDSVESGVNFDSLAVRNSDGPSATNGGRLRSVPAGRLAAPYVEAALALEDSTTVTQEPIRTQFGFHVIRLLDAGEPADTSQVRSYLFQQNQRKAIRAGIERARQEAEIEIRLNRSIVKANLDASG
jgi:peptidyl-prolyl cis-trans isomerase C